jgi:hypothetical protein
MALFTALPAALPYFLPELERFLVAIVPPFIYEKRRKENELRPKNRHLHSENNIHRKQS